MVMAKIAITLDKQLLQKIDHLIRNHIFPNRSKVIQSAVEEKISHIDRNRLSQECRKLDPKEEQALAEEGLEETAWPDY